MSATKEFLTDLSVLLFDADQLTSARRIQQLRTIQQHVQDRAIGKLSSAPVDQVELTEEQWEKIEGNVRFSLASANAER
jgi:hypothetical protein